VLDAPEEKYASASAASKAGPVPRRTVAPECALGRDYSDKYGADEVAAGDEQTRGGRRGGVRVRFDGGVVPKTIWGRVAAGAGLVAVLGVSVAAVLYIHNFLLRDDHFTVMSSSSIQIEGNAHLTRPQLLSVFGEDVERNIFRLPLADRRAELERLPWVGHATVMRLLPNRVRVAVVERTPVAYVRQGRQIGLVDGHGVLLDVAAAEPDEPEGPERSAVTHYSFPVLTGISAGDPMSTRAARMKIYLAFVAALDASGAKVSSKLSEVDLSNPEDVKALIPDHDARGDVDILVHFGGERFLERYTKYEAHLAEWKTQYPRLASVDMRYERQVVLEMAAGSAVPTGAPATFAPGDAPPQESATASPAKAKTPAARVALKSHVKPQPPVSAAVLKARALARAAADAGGTQ
jgi:cell division protein FtsQ